MLELIPFISNNRMGNYDPFKDIESFEKHFFGTDRISSFKTDIKDNGDEYLLEADLPGFKKEDIEVGLENNYLTIKAERRTRPRIRIRRADTSVAKEVTDRLQGALTSPMSMPTRSQPYMKTAFSG